MEILPYKRLMGQKTHRFFDMADKARRTAFDGSLRNERTNLHSPRIRSQAHQRRTFCISRHMVRENAAGEWAKASVTAAVAEKHIRIGVRGVAQIRKAVRAGVLQIVLFIRQ